MSGTCGIPASPSAGASGTVPTVSVAEFVWSPDGIRGRTGEVLSSRDPRGGEEVEACDAIDSEPPLASPFSRSGINHPKCFRERRGQISRLK